MTRRNLISAHWVWLGIALYYSSGSAWSVAEAQTKPAAPVKTSIPTIHTADGKPDLQGTWSFATLTPLERPANLAGKEFFSEQDEMGHEARIIPTDGRPHLPDSVRLWKGDSRGHWDGDTLVVETTNFSDKNPFRGSGPALKLIERFRRVDADTLMYQFIVDDKETWERPWTVEIPVIKSQGQLFEYACHEGNYGLEGALRGSRTDEKQAAGK